MGLINFKIINDLDLIKKRLTNDNIIIMNWSSSINYAYINNNEIVINPINTNIINKIDKKRIITCGDTLLPKNIKKPILEYEFNELVIFNFL